LKYKQDGVLDKNRVMDNVQKHNVGNMETEVNVSYRMEHFLLPEPQK
jgi:hypothetical protein